ncbi:MAG: chemotaxis protein CheA [Bacteroidales bacterium]|nr:chemotaxis protein CheA [Bacteroidales bacterium]MBN2750370.1 chemotaxis protein CheA [Bacteroidales bacterium]
MDNFKKKFIEEATDLIDGLEKALLALEENSDDPALIQQVFRVMHTLKGNSGMFGFDLIDRFTHDLETVYDLIRNGSLRVTRQVLDVTLAAVDHLKLLLNEDNYSDKDFIRAHEQLTLRVASLIDTPQALEQAAESVSVLSNADECTYYILFEPRKEIFSNGTNPLYLIDEVASLGNSLVFAHLNRVPKLKDINPENCYTYWEIILVTKEGTNAINDVFIFVEDESSLDIQKLADLNLLNDSTFVAEAKRIAAEKEDIGYNMLQTLAEKVMKQQQQKQADIIKREKITVKDTTISSIRVSSEKLDVLMNLVSELVTTQARLSLFAEQNAIPGLTAIAENVQKLSRQLRDTAFSIVLIPIENMLTRFQRLVRDLSNELHKDVVFITEGSDTELDKTIIESLADPLMHILRNSLDHGIEDADVRQKLGKPRQGKIILKAFYSGASVLIQVSDDGAGIDPELIREKAIAKGIIAADRKLSLRETLDLVFLPGFSTAKKVTDVSGRGVGMDVVRRKIADIRGEVEIDSEKGVGTTITIKLPLTLSIIDGLLVKIDDTHYVVPLSAIDKIYAVPTKEIYEKYNNVVILDGRQVSFFNLREEFNVGNVDSEFMQVVVVNYEEKRVGLVVDHVVGEYQAVLKPLGKHYKSQEMVSGATILGDGTVALVVDTNKIIKQFASKQVTTNK